MDYIQDYRHRDDILAKPYVNPLTQAVDLLDSRSNNPLKDPDHEKPQKPSNFLVKLKHLLTFDPTISFVKWNVTDYINPSKMARRL
jgi:hypothetical protein